ncbi:MAG: glycosyl transferase [Candidatus Anoxymicrobium japonicum]|uniref:Glycosyl transferase n=1 Tax=Candidatus Anoxymicrobium japonicum TaxID=2013648 RepID=A0A2N3G8B4_9ACTN|nr:MAG: glycosyl transferase [Candidatus Anoxymicrobium japonicum]
MDEQPTIVIHDWDDTDGASKLARSLSSGPLAVTARKIAVVAHAEHRAARELLASMGFEVIQASVGATSGERKNMGIKSARGDVALLSSKAQLIDNEWLSKLSEEAGSSLAGVVGCKVVDDRGMILNAGFHVLSPECELFPLGGGKKDINQYYYAREVEGVDSTCMYIRREALDRVGGFDADLDGHYDDLDFCLNVKSEGFPVMCAGRVKVAVHGGADTARQVTDAAHEAYRERRAAYYADRYDTRVMWHSWINAPTGYAVSSQYLVLALEQLNVDVRYGFVYGVEEAPNDDRRIMEVRRKTKDLDVTQVVYGQGDVFFKNSGAYRVGYSMLEVTGIPADWVEQANALDEVWVPSQFNKETFAASGVTKPLYVMPLGVDTNYFHPFIDSREIEGRFVFLSVFEWGERKAPEALLQAYNQEFSSSDDVLLLLKVNNTDPAVNIERHIEAMRLRAERAPMAIVLNQNISSYQMGSLYCSSDCFVLPTRGEGWGMPTLEAMACGLPTISTSWSAQTEFFNDDVGYPINIKGLIPAVAKCPYYDGFEWADPDVDHLASLMRRVYDNRKEARAKGLRASIQAREKWTWLDAARRIKARLCEISG